MPEPTEVEREATQLKRDLDGWREVLLIFRDILVWRHPLDPVFIFGLVTFAHLMYWFLDMSVITFLGMFGVDLALVDYLVPRCAEQFVPHDYWTAQKEREMEIVCRQLAVMKVNLKKLGRYCLKMRREQPKKFYLITISIMAFLTWLGNSVDNQLLSYIIVLAVLLTPGLSKRGFLVPVRKLLIFVFEKQD